MKNRVLLILTILSFYSLTASAQSWLWGKQDSTGLKSFFTAGNVATNKTGNVYHTGSFSSVAIFGTHTLVSSGESDIYLVKYDPNGNVLWARGSNTLGYYAWGYSVATDDSDNAYVTGVTGGLTVFGTDTLWESEEVFLVKYDPNGNVVWATQPDYSIADGAGYDVATDNSGHIYVTGLGAFVLKYDRNGTLVWSVTPTATYKYLYSNHQVPPALGINTNFFLLLLTNQEKYI